ncbi:MAG: alpha/beta hydrolase [Oscillospiraceae bacterium]|nr:alpha/beta hydrolase [Oscillospiraceae bacterium]
MEHKFLQSENGTVHYWVTKPAKSGAKCIVFTHGLTANHTMFEKQIDFFKDEYCVILWDVPLHGLSVPYKDFSYRQAALELKGILDKEHIEKAFLVGMSMGGYPCQMFGSMFPQKVEGFVALDTTPFGIAYYSKTDLWWLKQVEPVAKWFSDKMLRESMAKSVSKTPYSYNKMKEMLNPLKKEQIIQQMGIAYGQFAVENKDMTFPFPVLILLGDSDKTGKVKKYCCTWAQKTGYPLHIIRNAAHFANGDNPQQVNSEIKNFIEKSIS